MLKTGNILVPNESYIGETEPTNLRQEFYDILQL